MNMTVGMSVEMEMNVNMLDQLILLVQLSDVSVTSTNDYFYLMCCILLCCTYGNILLYNKCYKKRDSLFYFTIPCTITPTQ